MVNFVSKKAYKEWGGHTDNSSSEGTTNQRKVENTALKEHQ